MSGIIKSEIQLAIEKIYSLNKVAISEDKAFSHMLLKYYFGINFYEQVVTDGPNDGGIDFLHYDEEDEKVIVCQAKYTASLSCEDINAEFNKMHSTVENFMRSNTGAYNNILKQTLQDAIDRLPDDNSGNVEYRLFTIADIDTDTIKRKIENLSPKYPLDCAIIDTVEDIEQQIQKIKGSLETVKEAKVNIDEPRNYLRYESNDSRGVLCNISSRSIIQLYNKFYSAGLFDLNIRRYIRNTLVDNGIKKTLSSNRENFWFLNNGIIIACEDYQIDGNKIHLSNFSIVNGGQTTHLIATHKGNSQEFYLPCKIVATKDEKQSSKFFTDIAEATNSQKPIYPRDLKSNAPEMVRLAKWLQDEGIYLEIKRGYKPSFKPKTKIGNDELGQLILSFAYQKPGTSRSGKKALFENQNIYKQIYQEEYQKDPEKKQFVLDLIDLNDRYRDIESKFKTSRLTPDQLTILKNGKQTLFALMGLCSMLVNETITEQEILDNPRTLANIDPNFGSILSGYKADDIETKLEQIVYDIIDIVTDTYKKAFEDGSVTSVSNFMKTDSKYYNDIAVKFIKNFNYQVGKDIKLNWDIFKNN